MEPKDLVYDICRYYIQDQTEVEQSLINLTSGFLRSRDIKQLSTCSRHFDKHCHTVNDWRFLRQIEAFFKKNALFAHRETCFLAAQSSFHQNEERCSETNLRLKPYVEGTCRLDINTSGKVFKMQQYIRTVLGDFSCFLDDMQNLVRVTPGATAQSSRRNSLPQLKLRLKLFCTTRASKYVRSLFHLFGFENVRTKMTSSNRIELVPKNWKTDRTIACEPEGNLPLQLAFDTYVKRKLKRFNIDLRDQSANQRKAKHASIYNDFVTVDFSAASDTISYNTVALLLPTDWFNFLCDVRSPLYRGVFGQGTYSKFSSMGNGSTFCLETLIFAAACYACGSRNFLVYGDDVIIESKYYEDYIKLTQFLGFSINVDKSFHDGPFRESCGGDYFNGIDVTPVYIRGLDERKALLCHLVNSLGSLTFPGSRLGKYIFGLIPKYKLPLVPFNESTLSGVWIDPSKARRLGILSNRTIHKNSPCLNYFKSYVPKYKMKSFKDVRGYYLWFLNKNYQVRFNQPWIIDSYKSTPTQTSSVPIFQHGYVRKWVCWREPTEAMPDHILWLENTTPGPKGPGVK